MLSEEYKALREEIFTYIKQRHQLVALAVLSTGAILGVGLQQNNPYILLIPLIIIIPIMWWNRVLWLYIYYVSTYINVFIESQCNELNWHRLDTNWPWIGQESGKLTLVLNKIGTTTSIHAGLLVICSCLATTTWKNRSSIIWAINVLTAIVIVLNVHLASGRHRQKVIAKYHQQLRRIKEGQVEDSGKNRE